MSQYGKVEYWNHRYDRDRDPFDWYQNYEGIKHLMKPEDLSAEPFPSRGQCRVLILGCGNSRLGEDMLRDNWGGSIVNVDYSPVVIEQMKSKYNEAFYEQLAKPYFHACKLPSIDEGDEREEAVSPGKLSFTNMEFVCADVTEGLPFEDCSFDLIICKGTIDSILCSSGSVANAKRMMQECHRVLDDIHGAMMVVTYGNPDTRIVFFENAGKEWWKDEVRHHKVFSQRDNRTSKVQKTHYVYIAQKESHGEAKAYMVGEASQDSQLLQPSKSNEENDSSIEYAATHKLVERNPNIESSTSEANPKTKSVKITASRFDATLGFD